MSALLDDFVAIVDGLNTSRINYAVCGGWAMAIHGFLRATLDIDILILAEDLDKVIRIANDRGFNIEGLPLNFDDGKTQIRRISRIDTETKQLITLDLLLVTNELAEAWERRQRVKWNRGEYWIVSREGMIVMKEMAGRDKDLLDLKYLRGLDIDED
jgi:hypothetical protein